MDEARDIGGLDGEEDRDLEFVPVRREMPKINLEVLLPGRQWGRRGGLEGGGGTCEH